MSTRVAITGGAGFLGVLLARHLLDSGLAVGGAEPAEVGELIIADIAAPPTDLADHSRVQTVVGDLTSTLTHLDDVDIVFHLAGVVSSAAEQDFELGMRTNLDATRAMLDRATQRTDPPLVVFTSSLAVYGSDPALDPVGAVDDDTLPRPQSSYGIQKFICEQLVADYTRKEFIRGRSVRLMTVSVRPGKPNAAASSFLSGIVREPLQGQRAICPIPPDTPVALSSPRRTINGILCAAAVSDSVWGSRTAMNLPALSTTPAEMAAALDRVTGTNTSRHIDWIDDPAIAAIVRSWPASFRTTRAARLGLHPDHSFDEIINDFLIDNEGDTT